MKTLKELMTNPNWDLKTTYLVLIIIFVLSLGLRISQPFLSDRITKDGVLYVRMAKDLTKEHRIHKPFERNRRIPPLYIYMIAGFAKYLNISFETAGRFISILAGALLIFPVFFISEYIFDSRIAAISAILICFNPSLVDISATIMRDSLFATLLFSTIFFIIKSINMQNNKSFIFWILSGIFLTLAIATRNEAVEIVGITVVFILLCNSFKRTRLKLKLNILNLFAGFSLMLAISYIVSIPISNSLKGTNSTWTLIDQRIPSYLQSILHISKEEALKKEDTL